MAGKKSRYIVAQSTDWVIFVVNKVEDRPNQVRYQRVVALTQGFNLVVVTNTKLPDELEELAQEVHLVNKAFSTWSTVTRIAKRLMHEGNSVYVHTQYSPNPTIAGYLCKRRTGCKWIYDLWDHPSLGYVALKGPSRWARQLIWSVVRRWMLDSADAWVIAMHPAILGYLPPVPVSCWLIFVQPGDITDHNDNIDYMEIANNGDKILRIAYAGPIAPQRGLDQIMQWAMNYRGQSVELHLIGPCLDAASGATLRDAERECVNNSDLSLKVHGELSHSETLKILRTSQIGLCPLDMSVLNYRFAFPVKVIEQMRLGLIVVANQAHGVRAFIEDGKNGILAKNRKDGMSKALDRAITVFKDPEAANAMRDAAMEKVSEHSWPIVNKRLVKQLKNVLDT